MKSSDDEAPAAGEQAPGTGPEQQALHEALAGLLASVARLGVARGLPCAAAEEMLRLAFVHAAARAHPGCPSTARSAASAQPPASTGVR